MRRRFLALPIAAVTAVALAAPASAVAPTPTRLHMSHFTPAFHGHVASPVAFCERDRKVKLFKVRRGDDRLLGIDFSDDRGRWLVHHPKNSSGEYYARTPRKPRPLSGRVCARDESNHVVID